MKKLLLFCAVFIAGTAMSFAQFANIGIIGSATPTGWDSDTDMVTTDGITYTINDFTLTSGAVKFRQDDGWANNWGGTTFPGGTGVFNSATDIPATAGLYDITFNLTTLEYNFEDVGDFDEVSIVGNGLDVMLETTNGINYSASNVAFTAGDFAFKVNDAAVGWGSSAFPAGTAVEGSSIPVPTNNYNITFNKATGAYTFSYVIISITGDAVGGWGTDVNMTTTDGMNYSVANQAFTAGEVKFRLNNAWGTTWGNASFPMGNATVVADGGNMAIPAGTYDVVFNRVTGAFAFTAPTTGLTDIKAGRVTVYPNPSSTAWTFNTGNDTINSVQVIDVTGKVIYSAAPNATQANVSANGFASGIYFARLTAGTAVQTIRIVKN